MVSPAATAIPVIASKRVALFMEITFLSHPKIGGGCADHRSRQAFVMDGDAVHDKVTSRADVRE
jgi:hypothetical protein